MSKSFTIQSLYEALDLGLKTPGVIICPVRKANSSTIKSLCQALGSLTFAPKHHMINPCPSLEPPPDVAGGDTGGVSVEEM